MAIIGTAEQVAAYKALSGPRPSNERIQDKPCYNGAIVLVKDGYKNGAFAVMTWGYLPASTYINDPAHWVYHWWGNIPLTKTGRISNPKSAVYLDQIQAALAAYKQHDKADPEFVYIF